MISCVELQGLTKQIVQECSNRIYLDCFRSFSWPILHLWLGSSTQPDDESKISQEPNCDSSQMHWWSNKAIPLLILIWNANLLWNHPRHAWSAEMCFLGRIPTELRESNYNTQPNCRNLPTWISVFIISICIAQSYYQQYLLRRISRANWNLPGCCLVNRLWWCSQWIRHRSRHMIRHSSNFEISRASLCFEYW